MPSTLRLLIALSFALALAAPACADAVADTLVVLVRHAEKADDGGKDPALAPAGRARAESLAARLSGMRLDAVYATPYRRTRQTAEPAARAAGLAVREYAPDGVALLRALRESHRGQGVLVVGHSNTVPALVEALSGTAVPTIGDDEYGHLFVVAIAADGRARLLRAAY